MTDPTSAPLDDPRIRAELKAFGFSWLKRISWNEDASILAAKALAEGEVDQTRNGALVATTGTHTGRSPKDKYIVMDDDTAASVWWDQNRAMSAKHFENLKSDFLSHARLKNIFVQDLEACAAPAHVLNTRVITELAWHSLFIQHLLKPSTKADFGNELTIIDFPSFKADPSRHGTSSETVIAIDFASRTILIGGTAYAGEIKKAVFTYLNYALPEAGVLPMHCSANHGANNDTAIFFGLSGTGKTTLSADPSRVLIGDDEHGWSDDGVFNLENGCYAKTINLSRDAEPDIFNATQQVATILENVVINPVTGEPDFGDSTLTENTRAAYPLVAIANASTTRMGAVPQTIIMLCADAFGVLPPLAKLSPEQAMDIYLAGYTAKLAGTERGVKQPEATFSACFGAPFLPRHPKVYATMLGTLMAKHNVRCYLLNTGWTGGAYGVGSRIKLSDTRVMLAAILEGRLDDAQFRIDENFELAVPLAVPGVDTKLLNPRDCWQDKSAYDDAATNLSLQFESALRKLKPVPIKELLAAE
jgi:phosphoenolpyruvate carboxykinase (ATP)